MGNLVGVLLLALGRGGVVRFLHTSIMRGGSHILPRSSDRPGGLSAPVGQLGGGVSSSATTDPPGTNSSG